MKYKLLKDYPQLKAGCIGYPADKANYDFYLFKQDGNQIRINRDLVELTPDWFEPVIERWRADPKNYEYISEYYCLRSCGEVFSSNDSRGIYDQKTFDFGNYFKTSDQATEASKRIKQTLMDYHAELAMDQIK